MFTSQKQNFITTAAYFHPQINKLVGEIATFAVGELKLIDGGSYNFLYRNNCKNTSDELIMILIVLLCL